jgi:hypothetical protein
MSAEIGTNCCLSVLKLTVTREEYTEGLTKFAAEISISARRRKLRVLPSDAIYYKAYTVLKTEVFLYEG